MKNVIKVDLPLEVTKADLDALIDLIATQNPATMAEHHSVMHQFAAVNALRATFPKAE